jgi:hypothetical protein
MTEFEKNLARLINRHSVENGSNTPDYILAQYLVACLKAFEATTQQRETWYGRDGRPTSIASDGNVTTVSRVGPAKTATIEQLMPHVHDIYAALGVEWGGDPFAAIDALRKNA